MTIFCLTFDDGYKSHFDIVLPLLEKYGQRGTFFVTGDWLRDTEANRVRKSIRGYKSGKISEFMIWPEVKVLAEKNEIGNHLYFHNLMSNAHTRSVSGNIQSLDQAVEANGIKKTRTLCYPGFMYDEKAKDIVKKLGFIGARAGYVGALIGVEGERGHEPGNDPYEAKCFSVFGQGYKLPELIRDFEEKSPKVAILCFHDFLDTPGKLDMNASDFKAVLKWISENNHETKTFEEILAK